MNIELFLRWARREHRPWRLKLTLMAWAALYIMIIPILIAVCSALLDSWLALPLFDFGLSHFLLVLLLLVVGYALVFRGGSLQFRAGGGTPVPLVPTRRLVVQGPYRWCRNPITLGGTPAFLGFGLWLGSFSAMALALAWGVAMGTYIRLVEEKELAARFGEVYERYRRETPFLLPLIRPRD